MCTIYLTIGQPPLTSLEDTLSFFNNTINKFQHFTGFSKLPFVLYLRIVLQFMNAFLVMSQNTVPGSIPKLRNIREQLHCYPPTFTVSECFPLLSLQPHHQCLVPLCGQLHNFQGSVQTENSLFKFKVHCSELEVG